MQGGRQACEHDFQWIGVIHAEDEVHSQYRCSKCGRREDHDLVYRPNTTYECVYCGDAFIGNDKYRDIYRCDSHLLHSSTRPISGGNNNPVMIRLHYKHLKKIPQAIKNAFPLINDIVEKADVLTKCRFPDIAAHAHLEIYRVCIPGTANPSLWDDAYRPTTVLLHEYAHLKSGTGHFAPAFWAENKALHALHGVPYDTQIRIQEEYSWYPTA